MNKADDRPVGLNAIYLLRLWQIQESGQERDPLRIVVEDPRTGRRQAFNNLSQLVTFLEDLIAGRT